MVSASPHVHTLTTELISRGYLVGWSWPLAVAEIVGLVLIAAGVVLAARRRKSLSRAARIAVGAIAVWAGWVAVVVFLDAFNHGGDWRGGLVSAAFVVLYGLVGFAAVGVVDRTVKWVRRRPQLAP